MSQGCSVCVLRCDAAAEFAFHLPDFVSGDFDTSAMWNADGYRFTNLPMALLLGASQQNSIVSISLTLSCLTGSARGQNRLNAAQQWFGSNEILTSWIQVRGYQSLAKSRISFHCDDCGEVFCYGAYACLSAVSLEQVSECYGAGSGADGALLTSSLYTNAHGAFALNSSRLVNSEVSATECTGERSCANMTFDACGLITATGAYSLADTFIESNCDVNIQLSGHLAGYGGTLHCGVDHSCSASSKRRARK